MKRDDVPGLLAISLAILSLVLILWAHSTSWHSPQQSMRIRFDKQGKIYPADLITIRKMTLETIEKEQHAPSH